MQDQRDFAKQGTRAGLQLCASGDAGMEGPRRTARAPPPLVRGARLAAAASPLRDSSLSASLCLNNLYVLNFASFGGILGQWRSSSFGVSPTPPPRLPPWPRMKPLIESGLAVQAGASYCTIPIPYYINHNMI